MQRAVVSVDGTDYQDWQAQLLARTHIEVGQPGPLTRLWASDRPPTPWPWDTVVTPDYSGFSPIRRYTPFNRVVGLRDWFQAGGVDDDDTVLVVDPDMVFVDWVDIDVPHQAIAGTDWPFLTVGRSKPEWPGFVARNCAVSPASVPTVGYAYACRGRELGVLAEMLPDRIIEVQRDGGSPWDEWVDEMWAFVFCVAELGWNVTYPGWVSDVCDVDTGWPRPVLHYGFGVNVGWSWSKFTWKPGDPVPECSPAAIPAAQAFAALLSRHASTLPRPTV